MDEGILPQPEPESEEEEEFDEEEEQEELEEFEQEEEFESEEEDELEEEGEELQDARARIGSVAPAEAVQLMTRFADDATLQENGCVGVWGRFAAY